MFGICTLVSRLMPTGPSCPSLASDTSTKFASMVTRCRAALTTCLYIGSSLYACAARRVRSG